MKLLCRLSLFLSLLCVSWVIGSKNYQYFINNNDPFIIGSYYFIDQGNIKYHDTSYIQTLLHECFVYDSNKERIVSAIISHYNDISEQKLSLHSVYEKYKYNLTESSQKLSHDINACSIGKNYRDSELLWHISLSLYSENFFSVKNLAFRYECHGIYGPAYSLYNDCFNLTKNFGCILHLALLSPTLVLKEEDEIMYYRQSLNTFRNILINNDISNSIQRYEYPLYVALREFPMNIQYLPYSSRIIHELMTLSIHKYYPELNSIIPSNSNNNYNQQNNDRILLGIFSVDYENSSPGICIGSILIELVKLQGKKPIDIIFIDRPGLNTVFALEMRNIAVKTVVIKEEDIDWSIQKILDLNLDVLLYLALPTEKFSALTSLTRLAPIQLFYGIGHPLSSGSPAIDYTIISSEMMPSYKYITSNKYVNALECIKSVHNESVSIKNECYNKNTISYSEQVILFDSLGYYLEDPINLYKKTDEDINAPALLSKYSQYRAPLNSTKNFYSNNDISIYCEEIDLFFQEINNVLISEDNRKLGSNMNKLNSSEFGCVDKNGLVHYKRYHYYICIQLIRKMSPVFSNKILLGIIENDPLAKIIVSSTFYPIIERMAIYKSMRYNTNYDDERNKILEHIIFVPRLSHSQYLRVVALSDVFLNPIPFGSGITSSEAIAMCIPIISIIDNDTNLSNIIHFVYAQINSFQSDALNKLLFAKNINEFIMKAIALTDGEINHPIRNYLCNKKSTTLFNTSIINNVAVEFYDLLNKLVI